MDEPADPTTVNDLQRWLADRNLTPWYATADGSEPHDGYALRREDGGWLVYRCGPYQALKPSVFSDEHSAVKEIVRRLRDDGLIGDSQPPSI